MKILIIFAIQIDLPLKLLEAEEFDEEVNFLKDLLSQ